MVAVALQDVLVGGEAKRRRRPYTICTVTSRPHTFSLTTPMSSAPAGPSIQPLNPYQPFPPPHKKVCTNWKASLVRTLIVGKNERLQFSSEHPFIPSFVQSRLGKSRNLDPQALYENRVKNKQVLLENPARDSPLKKEQEEKKTRRAKERERKRLGLISKKQAKLRGLWKLEDSQRRYVFVLRIYPCTCITAQHSRYELFVPLHHLWLGYMSELLGLGALPERLPDSPPLPNSAAMHAKLVKADFHGSVLTGMIKASSVLLIIISLFCMCSETS